MSFIRLRQLDMLGKMLLASLLLHAIVISTLTFAPPDLKKFKDKMPPLEVVLVNAKTETAPEKADALAQANLDRGGNTEENRKAKSPLPASKRKPAKIALPRQIAMYLAKELTQKSLPEIGELFGGRDHTTVLHAVRKISGERQQLTELNQQLHVLEQTLKG